MKETSKKEKLETLNRLVKQLEDFYEEQHGYYNEPCFIQFGPEGIGKNVPVLNKYVIKALESLELSKLWIESRINNMIE